MIQNNSRKMPSPVSSRSEIAVACILDEFSFSCFAPEGQFTQLTPQKWQEELEGADPDLLLVESAWRGKGDLWTNTVSKCGADIRGIISWCKNRGIPTVFWNKEDPVHFSTFLNLAKYFDAVLTTDLDCVPRYKQLLGHSNVHFFPFAAQPRVHNPVELYERQDAFCLAGSYYSRYPERTSALESFEEHLTDEKPLIIFDRNYGSFGQDHIDYQFPERYSEYISGKLSPNEIDIAYKGFTTGINLNSVRNSQTMLARRVYELVASNTLVVSNFSPSLQTLFGGLILNSDRGYDVVRQLQSIQGTPDGERRLRAQALRKVLREHTYEDRLRKICQVVGVSNPQPEHQILVLARIRNQSEMDAVMASVRRQSIQPSLVVLIVENIGVWRVAGAVKLLSVSEIGDYLISSLSGNCEFLAIFDPTDFYGSHYLEDLLLAHRYVDEPIISKANGWSTDDSLSNARSLNEYSLSEDFALRRSLIQCSLVENEPVLHLINNETGGSSWRNEGRVQTSFVIDSFEYVAESLDSSSSYQSSSTEIVNEGYSLKELQTMGDSAGSRDESGSVVFDIAELSRLFGRDSIGVSIMKENGHCRVESQVELGKHVYHYAIETTPRENIEAWSDVGTLFVEATPGLDVMIVVLFLDKEGTRIGHTLAKVNTNQEFQIPENTTDFQFGLRIMGSGNAEILNVHLTYHVLPSVGVKLRAKHLVLTNIYPSYDDLYRNGFVHSRVKAYRESGLDVAVVRLVENSAPTYREFEGITVIELNKKMFKELVLENEIETVLVHFLDPDMWEILKDGSMGVKVHIWMHGAEVQPWWRREYNSVTGQELEKAKALSQVRMEFWHNVFGALPDHVDFVFVSNYFAEEVMEDVGIRLPGDKYQIIHNPIDSEIFNYVPKPVHQRKKILTIRPYASRKYANDISVATVLELSKEPFFEDLHFRFIGDGPLFDEILAPIKEFDNVQCERRFLSHVEISKIHKEYGVFLTPTRMDAQGVSRDEAMSSGLVPLTTDVAAIPEFVDFDSGFLAPLDDHHALADGIRALYREADLFSRMSVASSQRVRGQSGKRIVAEKELNLILGKG